MKRGKTVAVKGTNALLMCLMLKKNTLIRDCNNIGNRNAKNSYLTGLIGVNAVKRRRPRCDEEEALLHNLTNCISYTYKVRIVRGNSLQEIPVCVKGFVSIFGITARRVQKIRESLATKGQAPIDQRGKHKNRGKNKLSDETYDAMKFFQFFERKKSSLQSEGYKENLPSGKPNVKKLLSMFLEKYPEIEISYETFREHFATNFNIGFGYPRTDTCSTCDAQKV